MEKNNLLFIAWFQMSFFISSKKQDNEWKRVWTKFVGEN